MIRQTDYSESTGTSTSTSFVEKALFDFTPEAGETYFAFASCAANNDNSANRFRVFFSSDAQPEFASVMFGSITGYQVDDYFGCFTLQQFTAVDANPIDLQVFIQSTEP